MLEQLHWIWLCLGVMLVTLEMLLPGVFLLWIGFAAIGTSAITFATELHMAWQLLVFAGLSIIFTWLGQKLAHHMTPQPAEQSLNRRAEALLNQTFTLNNPIIEGQAQLMVGDSVWNIQGQDLDAGTRIRVTKVEGNTLMVEAAEQE